MGKSTVIGALAKAAARAAKRPLIVKRGFQTSPSHLFHGPDVRYEPTEVSLGVHATRIEFEPALVDYITSRLRLRAIATLVATLTEFLTEMAFLREGFAERARDVRDLMRSEAAEDARASRRRADAQALEYGGILPRAADSCMGVARGDPAARRWFCAGGVDRAAASREAAGVADTGSFVPSCATSRLSCSTSSNTT